jgi:predicted acyltransferase
MKAERLVSLDAFRGFAIGAMLLVNNPGDWANVYAPLLHAHWNGWTFTDWVFPFFVFIAGMSMAISLTRRAAAGADKPALLAQAWRRALTIVAIGLLLNLIPGFDVAHLRIPGVLQRLGLCSLAAAPIALWCRPRGVALWAVALMAVYALVQLRLPVPDVNGVVHTGLLEPGQDAGAWLDRLLLDGHLWKTSRTWDPEGLLSTLPAVASQLLGVLAGHVLLSSRQPAEKAMTWVVAGLASLWIGQVLDATLMPINKSLWTPAFVFAMTGWALLAFATFYWLLDASPQPMLRERWARCAHPLVVLGMNAILLFALSGLVAKALIFIKLGDGRSLGATLYQPILDLGLAPKQASLLHAIAFVLAMYAVAWVMYRKHWFVKV